MMNINEPHGSPFVSIRKRSVSSIPSKPMRVERRTSKGLSRPP
jgi:hypothetical protein